MHSSPWDPQCAADLFPDFRPWHPGAQPHGFYLFTVWYRLLSPCVPDPCSTGTISVVHCVPDPCSTGAISVVQYIFAVVPNPHNIMRSKSWHWDHFHRGERANSTHFKAYCKYHTKYHIDHLERDEEAAFNAGTIEMMQAKDVLLPEGVSNLSIKHQLDLIEGEHQQKMLLVLQPESSPHSITISSTASLPLRR